MTTLIEKIQAEIDQAANDRANDGTISPHTTYYDFKAGAAFVLPLLKKAIEQRDWFISEKYFNPALSWTIEEKNQDLLKLIGCEHE